MGWILTLGSLVIRTLDLIAADPEAMSLVGQLEKDLGLGGTVTPTPPTTQANVYVVDDRIQR